MNVYLVVFETIDSRNDEEVDVLCVQNNQTPAVYRNRIDAELLIRVLARLYPDTPYVIKVVSL